MIGFEQTQVMARMWQIVNNNSILPFSVSWKIFWSISRYSSLSMKNIVLRDGRRYQIGWIFGKVPKGGGGHFQKKITLQIFDLYIYIYKGFFQTFSENNCKIIFRNEGGGVELCCGGCARSPTTWGGNKNCVGREGWLVVRVKIVRG